MVPRPRLLVRLALSFRQCKFCNGDIDIGLCRALAISLFFNFKESLLAFRLSSVWRETAPTCIRELQNEIRHRLAESWVCPYLLPRARSSPSVSHQGAPRKVPHSDELRTHTGCPRSALSPSATSAYMLIGHIRGARNRTE